MKMQSTVSTKTDTLSEGKISSARKCFHPRAETVGTAIIVGLFLLINLMNLGRYGMSYDEPAGTIRGQDTERILSSTFGGTPMPRLTTDHRFHPSFYAFLNYEVTNILKERSVDPIAAGHVLNLIVAAFGLCVLYLFAGRIFGRRIGMFAVLLLALYPRFVAHAHYNGKDIPVMVFSLLTYYLLYLAVISPSAKTWLLAGYAFGISVATKLDALVVIPTFLYAFLLARIITPQRVKWQFRGPVLFAIVSPVVVYFLWPALWTNPFFIFGALRFFSGDFVRFNLSYLGQSYPIAQLPWHYTALHLAAVTPAAVLIFTVIGLCLLARRFRRHENVFEITLLLSWILLPLLPRCFHWMLQYDGMRHVFIVIPALVMIAAVGLDWCAGRVAHLTKSTPATIVTSVAVAGWLLYQCVQVHPYEGSYLNEIVRTVVPRTQLGEYFDFYSWATPLHDVIPWLNKNVPQGCSIYVVAENLDPVLKSYPLRPDIILRDRSDADYILTWHAQKPHDTQIVFALKCYDSNVLSVYRREVSKDGLQ